MLNISGKYIYRDDRRPTDYNRICSESLDQSLKGYIITISLVILSFVGALLGPFCAYIQNGRMVTLYSVRLPFLQHHPNTELTINVSWETFMSLMGVVALFGMEVMFALVNDTITVSSQLCELELNELSEMLERQGPNEKSHQKLRFILMKTQFMDE